MQSQSFAMLDTYVMSSLPCIPIIAVGSGSTRYSQSCNLQIGCVLLKAWALDTSHYSTCRHTPVMYSCAPRL
jgi:hypothetical protein